MLPCRLCILCGIVGFVLMFPNNQRKYLKFKLIRFCCLFSRRSFCVLLLNLSNSIKNFVCQQFPLTNHNWSHHPWHRKKFSSWLNKHILIPSHPMTSQSKFLEADVEGAKVNQPPISSSNYKIPSTETTAGKKQMSPWSSSRLYPVVLLNPWSTTLTLESTTRTRRSRWSSKCQRFHPTNSQQLPSLQLSTAKKWPSTPCWRTRKPSSGTQQLVSCCKLSFLNELTNKINQNSILMICRFSWSSLFGVCEFHKEKEETFW